MTFDELVAASQRNLTDTYLALGAATGCSELLEGAEAVGCVGDFPHPMCNFAICSTVAKDTVEQLKAIAATHPGFHAYVCVAKGARSPGSLFLKTGFRQVHGLVQMASPPAAEPREIPLSHAVDIEDRRKVARFMMAQFFSRHPDWIRDKVCEATASAKGLDLYALQGGRGFSGAVMLCPCEKSVGLYNLCVAVMERRRGYGASIVRAVQAHAAQRSAPVILQCSVELEHWYRSLSFQPIGTLEVYALPPASYL